MTTLFLGYIFRGGDIAKRWSKVCHWISVRSRIFKLLEYVDFHKNTQWYTSLWLMSHDLLITFNFDVRYVVQSVIHFYLALWFWIYRPFVQYLGTDRQLIHFSRCSHKVLGFFCDESWEINRKKWCKNFQLAPWWGLLIRTMGQVVTDGNTHM